MTGPPGGSTRHRTVRHRTDRESNVSHDPFRRSNRATWSGGHACPSVDGSRRSILGPADRPSCRDCAPNRSSRRPLPAVGRDHLGPHDARRNVVAAPLLTAGHVRRRIGTRLQHERDVLGLRPRRLRRVRRARAPGRHRPPHRTGVPRDDRVGRAAPDRSGPRAHSGQRADARPDRDRPGPVVPRDRLRGSGPAGAQPPVPPRDHALRGTARNRDGSDGSRPDHPRVIRVRGVRLDGHLAAVVAARARPPNRREGR